MPEHSEEKIPMTLDLAADALRDRIAEALVDAAHDQYPEGMRPGDNVADENRERLAAVAAFAATRAVLDALNAEETP